MSLKYSAIVVAAGKGERMGLGYNKVYYPLSDGLVLEKTLSVFENDMDCKQIVLVTDEIVFHEYLSSYHSNKLMIVSGGQTRQESVMNGLSNVQEDYVMIHDGARPFVEQSLLDHLKDALLVHDAACLMVPVKDTIKVVKDGYIQETIPRETLMAAQTPQAFKTELIKTCMNQAIDDGFIGTDDCSLVERYTNEQIVCVMGDYRNKKITTPEDVA